MLYSILFLFLSTSTALYVTRDKWLPHITSLPIPHFYQAVQSSFANDIESGLTSSNFDLQQNLVNDPRSGLDNAAKQEVLSIMRGGWFRRPVNFDEARRIYMERMLERQGIGRDGRPRDPKLVTFS